MPRGTHIFRKLNFEDQHFGANIFVAILWMQATSGGGADTIV